MRQTTCPMRCASSTASRTATSTGRASSAKTSAPSPSGREPHTGPRSRTPSATLYGRTPLYTIGPDDPEALTGSDIDLGELAEMLRPVGATGICDWLLAHNELGTHVAEASVSDQYLACDAAVAAGKAVLGTLMAIAAAEHSDDVLWFLYHQGLEEQTETPPQDPDYPVPDPVRVPPVLPGTFDVYDLTDALLERSHVLTSSEAISIARTCLWLVSRAHLNGKHRCRTLPIFASGADVPEATQHDLEALASQGGAQWVQLNYEGPNKPGDGGSGTGATLSRSGQPSNVTSIRSLPRCRVAPTPCRRLTSRQSTESRTGVKGAAMGTS